MTPAGFEGSQSGRALGSGVVRAAVGAVAVLLAGGCAATSTSGTPRVPAMSIAMVGGHARAGTLTITGAYIPDPATPSLAAAYFTVTNDGPADRLLSIHTSLFRGSQLNRYQTVASGAEMMVPVYGGLVIPAHSRLILQPGHDHVMLTSPRRVIRQGSTVILTLRFAHAGTLRLTVPVVAATGLPTTTTSQMPDMNMSGSSMSPGMRM